MSGFWRTAIYQLAIIVLGVMAMLNNDWVVSSVFMAAYLVTAALEKPHE